MAITLITITGTVRKGNGDAWPCAQFTIDLVSTIVADADAESVYPRGKQTIDCDENGLIPTTGTVPTVAAGYTYKLTLPDGANGNFVVPVEAAPTVTIDAIVALIAGGEANPTEGYTGVTLAEAAWLTLALATVPTASDLIPDAPSDGTQYARKDAAWEAVASGGASDVDDLTTDTGNATEMVRVNGAGTGLEYRTPAQVLSDIGAEISGAATTAYNAAIQRANHTGVQALATVTDAGSEFIVMALSAVDGEIATSTAAGFMICPYDGTISEVGAALVSAATGSAVQVDIEVNGASILSTEITIDATETDSETAVTPPVISSASISKYDRIIPTIDAVGSSTPGIGLVVYMLITR